MSSCFLLVAADAQSFVPVLIQLAFVLAFVGATTIGSPFLGVRRGGRDKFINFECGIQQQGDARRPVAVKYFLIAILFVIFDVELVFLYPYAVNFKWLGERAFWGVLAFVGMFLVGYIYVLRQGVMKWED